MALASGYSGYLPSKVDDNEDLVKFPEKYRNVIVEKAGVLSRCHVEEECTSDLGAMAVKNLQEKKDIFLLKLMR